MQHKRGAPEMIKMQEVRKRQKDEYREIFTSEGAINTLQQMV